MSKPPERLVDFPYVVVRLRCSLCPRRGAYRLARLVEKFGADARLTEVLYRIAFDCRWMRAPHMPPPRKYEARCGARFADLEAVPPRPADVPAEVKREGLKVVPGGKS